LLTRTPSSFKQVGSNPPNEIIDREVFNQVLELDEDDEDFSKEMVDAYFVQADKTFKSMDAALCAFSATLLASAP
jgi:osomolarity two-component system phosphorelay intermediate protein YPD1